MKYVRLLLIEAHAMNFYFSIKGSAFYHMYTLSTFIRYNFHVLKSKITSVIYLLLHDKIEPITN